MLVQVKEGRAVSIAGKVHRENAVLEVDDATFKKFPDTFKEASKEAVETFKAQSQIAEKRTARAEATKAKAEAKAEKEK